jgi:hypothetical protein
MVFSLLCNSYTIRVQHCYTLSAYPTNLDFYLRVVVLSWKSCRFELEALFLFVLSLCAKTVSCIHAAASAFSVIMLPRTILPQKDRSKTQTSCFGSCWYDYDNQNTVVPVETVLLVTVPGMPEH